MTHRLITDRTVTQGEVAAAAAHVAGEGRFGEVDGVLVDFRHPDLPATEWEARAWWYVCADSPAHAGILFPSEAAAADEVELRARRRLSPEFQIVRADSGDKISIRDVKVIEEDRRFDHPHDRESRTAYLRIERPTGEVVDLLTPLTFYGRTQIRNGATREAFDHIIARIVHLSDARNLEYDGMSGDEPGAYWGRALDRVALEQARDAHREYFDLLDTLSAGDGGATSKDLLRAQGVLRSLVNAASLAGFLLAKAEAIEAEAKARERERELDAKRDAGKSTRKGSDEERYERVQQLLARKAGLSQSAAIEHVARDLGVSVATVRGSYYKLKKCV